MFLQMKVREIIKTKKLVPRELLQNITNILGFPHHQLAGDFFPWAVLTSFTLKLFLVFNFFYFFNFS